MGKVQLPLEVKSVKELFNGGEKCRFEIPIYQRNYSWEKEEIAALLQDVYDAFTDKTEAYYIGTLVTYHRGDQVYEIIDGQQRLTTLWIILNILGERPQNKLTFRARKKSNKTVENMPNFNLDDRDDSIINGYHSAQGSIDEIIPIDELEKFKNYFTDKVKIIHYQVPKDVNLNHYFEVMNSRGEQLEKHEIVKAKLMSTIKDEHDMLVFSQIWNSCSEMGSYVQQLMKNEAIFGGSLSEFLPENFSMVSERIDTQSEEKQNHRTIAEILADKTPDSIKEEQPEKDDQFQPIIDFPNFLLVVLKVMQMKKADFDPSKFNLDDKFLLKEFEKPNADIDARKFAYYLLKSKYLLDNFIVHHIKDEEKLQNKPWMLQKWTKVYEDKRNKFSYYPKNISDSEKTQNDMVQLLSMFEVSFTARQRKNYLFYCLLYLIDKKEINLEEYNEFLRNLAERYFMEVYLSDKLNSINVPNPGSFDEAILPGNSLKTGLVEPKDKETFLRIYGDGTVPSKGIPLFIFNYMDYRIWQLYSTTLQGQVEQRASRENEFFDALGCSNFGAKVLNEFYFSRTRRSLEHYYPQAMATGIGGHLDKNQINCFGNYAMIGSEANSSGSNWTPHTKLDHYLDASGKINQVSVASLKFIIMMHICKEKEKWEFEEVMNHQEKMLAILGLL